MNEQSARLIAHSLIAAAICLIGFRVGTAEEKPHHPLDIRPNTKADWQASPNDVKAVLNSAARQLWKQFPDRELTPILVEPKGGPIVLFQRGENGEYRVRLATGQTYWSQYAFQFAHEMCHILCNYDGDVHRNKWFEESLCETASLYSLRAMADEWKTNPPYPNWKGYSSSLKQYADDRIAASPLPEGKSLADWFADHEATLYQNATNREMNNIVAVQLLPLLEENPANWEAVTWLNEAKSTQSQTFGEYLSDWHKHAPREASGVYSPHWRAVRYRGGLRPGGRLRIPFRGLACHNGICCLDDFHSVRGDVGRANHWASRDSHVT